MLANLRHANPPLQREMCVGEILACGSTFLWDVTPNGFLGEHALSKLVSRRVEQHAAYLDPGVSVSGRRYLTWLQIMSAHELSRPSEAAQLQREQR